MVPSIEARARLSWGCCARKPPNPPIRRHHPRSRRRLPRSPALAFSTPDCWHYGGKSEARRNACTGGCYPFRMRERNAVLRFVRLPPFFALPSFEDAVPGFALWPSKTMSSGAFNTDFLGSCLTLSPFFTCLKYFCAPACPNNLPARPARDRASDDGLA